MTKRFNYIFALALLSLTSVKAHAAGAGIFVEPGVTYQSLSGDVGFYPSTLSNGSAELKGFGLMGRLGLHAGEVFFLAMDGRYAQPKYFDATNRTNVWAKSYDVGPVVGLQMPNAGLRLWGEYIMLGATNPDEANGIDMKFSDARGWRFGAGIHVYSVSVNIEYEKVKHHEAELEKIGSFPVGTKLNNLTYTVDGLIGSVSFPIEL